MISIFLAACENLCIVIERFEVIQAGNVLYSDDGFNLENSEWGRNPMTETCLIETSSDLILHLCCYSATEKIKYEGQISLDEINSNIKKICLGVSIDGLVAVWNCCDDRNILLKYGKLNKVPIILESITPWNPFVTYNEYTNNCINTVNTHVNNYPSNESLRQYVYRYIVQRPSHDSEVLVKGDVESINALVKDICIDGSFDCSYDGFLEKYHKSGVVSKTIVNWREGKSNYVLACFFDEKICGKFFSKYYGMHNETNTDLIFLIDTKNNSYKIYFYRYGNQKPIEFPENAYKIIVFKSGFEKFRTENYDIPQGTWAW